MLCEYNIYRKIYSPFHISKTSNLGYEKAEQKENKLKEEPKVPNNVCVNLPIQPKSRDTEGFRIKAGWWGGLRPRPESYNISGNVVLFISHYLFSCNSS